MECPNTLSNPLGSELLVKIAAVEEYIFEQPWVKHGYKSVQAKQICELCFWHGIQALFAVHFTSVTPLSN